MNQWTASSEWIKKQDTALNNLECPCSGINSMTAIVNEYVKPVCKLNYISITNRKKWEQM